MVALAPHFHDDTAGRSPRRVSFQFAASGTKQVGVLYVTMDVEGDAMALADKAAKVAARRAGCAAVVLHRIMAPVR